MIMIAADLALPGQNEAKSVKLPLNGRYEKPDQINTVKGPLSLNKIFILFNDRESTNTDF